MVEIHIRHGQASAQSGQLTEEGEAQSRSAADFLNMHYPRDFRVVLHSGSTRAAATANLLGIDDWSIDKRLREMSGESWDEGIMRVAGLIEELDLADPDADRILVYHGDAMHAARAYREGFRGDRFELLFAEPYKYFTNCQLIIYTDENPETGLLDPHRLWVKSVCPWAIGKFGHDWLPVTLLH